MPTPVFNISAKADLDTSSDRHFHQSLKSWEGYEGLGLPKSVFWKLDKITSKAFLERNPLIAKVKYRGKLHYGYGRANRAKEHGEALVQKKFSIRQSLADALAQRAKEEKLSQTELVEQALGALLGEG